MTSELLTTAQIAERWGRSQRWVQKLIKSGRLKGIEIGSIQVVKRKDVDSFVHKKRGQPRKAKGNGRRK